MPSHYTGPIFDGHNDAVQRLAPFTTADLQRFLDGRDAGKGGEASHIDLPRSNRGGLAAGMFAVFARPLPVVEDPFNPRLRISEGGYEVQPDPAIDPDHARRTNSGQLDALRRIASISDGRVRIATTVMEIDACARDGSLGIVLNMEGAEGIDPHLGNLDDLYAGGVRSLGITWSRPNAFGHGVPFRFPVSPDTGPGLTPAGIQMVRRCNELGILVDVSHLNAAGFTDVVRTSRAPIVATHSSAWSICPSTRNLTDDQLAAIRDSDGLVGVNFEVSANRADGYDEPDTPIDVLVTMIEYLVRRVGVEQVGFGSDFDGATMPSAIGDVAGLPLLIQALENRGFSAAEIEALAWGNWLRVLAQTWR